MAKVRISKAGFDRHVLAETKQLQRNAQYIGSELSLEVAKKKAEKLVSGRYEIIK